MLRGLGWIRMRALCPNRIWCWEAWFWPLGSAVGATFNNSSLRGFLNCGEKRTISEMAFACRSGASGGRQSHIPQLIFSLR